MQLTCCFTKQANHKKTSRYLQEHIFGLRFRLGQIAGQGERQSGPVEGVQVIASHIVARFVFGVGKPVADSENAPLRDQMVNAGVPVKDYKYVVCERQRAKEIRVVGVSLGAVKKRQKAIDFHQSKASENRIKAHGQVEKVGRKQTQAVYVEHRAVHVVLAQLFGVGLQDTFVCRKREVY